MQVEASRPFPPPKRLDYEMHLPIPEGEVFGFQDESDGFRFAWLEMNAFEAAEVLFISRHAGHEFMRVELNDFIAFARTGVPLNAARLWVGVR